MRISRKYIVKPWLCGTQRNCKSLRTSQIISSFWNISQIYFTTGWLFHQNAALCEISSSYVFRNQLLKLTYDRNFPRDQLFCNIGKLRFKETSFFGHIIVICLLGLRRKLNQTESPKTVLLLRIFKKIH